MFDFSISFRVAFPNPESLYFSAKNFSYSAGVYPFGPEAAFFGAAFFGTFAAGYRAFGAGLGTLFLGVAFFVADGFFAVFLTVFLAAFLAIFLGTFLGAEALVGFGDGASSAWTGLRTLFFMAAKDLLNFITISEGVGNIGQHSDKLRGRVGR